MCVDVITCGLVFTLVILVLYLLTRRRSGLPPGPALVPVLGNFLSMDQDFRVISRKFRRRYGDVFSLYVFNQPIIFLNGYNVLKDALVKNGDVFSDRPHSFLTDQISQGKGVVSTSGPVWKEQRKFALSTLRDLGMGKSVIEDKVQEELSFFLKTLEDEKHQPFDCSPVLHNAVSNIICSVVFGKRFEYTDPLFRRYLQSIQENIANIQAANTLNMLPLLKYLPGDLFKFKKMLSNVDILENELIKPSIEEHLRHQDDDTKNDFISAYIREMQIRKKQDDNTSMDQDNLTELIANLFVAGTETTATTIRWALVYFMNYPEVLEKCFREIEENIGLNRPPSMKDKTSLPYLEATIMEVLRCGDIVPGSVPHAVSQDVQFHGYTFPKGVTVIPMLSSVLEDPDVWGDPENFRPQRFLDDTGKVRKMEGLISFSLGRRVCLGESLARMELFIFLASMIQKFEFVPADGVKPSLEGVIGGTHSPQPFKLKLVQRF